MKILVTGATGFVGSNIVAVLLKQGYQVKALVRKTSEVERLKQKKVVLVYGDLLVPKTLEAATKNIEVIIHAAGIEGRFGITLNQLRQIHVKGTKNLLQAAKRNRVKRLIHISSIAAMGLNQTADEETRPKPKTSYEQAKYEAEKVVKLFCKREKIKYTIIRPGSVYGPGEMKQKANLFQLIQKQKFFIIGNGKNLMNFVYTENLNQGILLALTKKKAINNTYIIADKKPYQMNEFVKTIVKQLKVKMPSHLPKSIAYMVALILEAIALITQKEPLLSRGRIRTLTASSVFSIEKARKELVYQPQIDLEKGIAKTIAWYKGKGFIR